MPIRLEDLNGGIKIIGSDGAQIQLAPDEVNTLWHWLSEHMKLLKAQQLEIRLYQQDLSHLDELKAVIPDLHERGPIVKVFDVGLESVTDSALKLLKSFQIEYHVHPMLEDQDAYAQG